MHPTRFAFGVMTRSKAITYDDLALRAPDFVEEVDTLFAREVAGNAEPADTERPPMFQPFRLRGMRLANRVVVSPMCQYSAEDGMPTDWHLVHYGARATGGAGLIYTEMTCPSADARITPGCAGLWNDAQEAAWTRIVALHPRPRTGENLPATRPCRPQRRHAADVGRHGPAAAAGRLADHLRLRHPVLRRTTKCHARWTEPTWTAS